MRRVIAGILFGALSVVAVPTAAQAAPAHRSVVHCPQYHDVFIEFGRLSEAEWRRVDRIMWRVSRCDPDKVTANRRGGATYGLMQIYWRPDYQSVTIATGLPTLATACFMTNSPLDLADPAVSATCTGVLIRAFGFRPWGG